MSEPSSPRPHDHAFVNPPEPWWPTLAAAGFIVGIVGATWMTSFAAWWGVAAAGLVLLPLSRVVFTERWRGGLPTAGWLLALIGIGGAWSIARQPDPAGPTLVAYLQPAGALAELEGVVVSEPVLGEGTAGPFADFGYETPATQFEIRVERIRTADGFIRANGLLGVNLKVADHRLQLGQRIRGRGWLAPIGPPMNQGDFDYRTFVAERGIVGRFAMASRGNWDLLEGAGLTTRLWGPASWLQEARGHIARRAAWSLGLGMGEDTQTLGLLQTLLLGETQTDIDTLRDQFRDVGLAHILSISGAHLGILMGMVWLIVRLIVPHPPRAAVIVLAILVMYLLAVPLRVPIVRASVMAGLYFTGIAAGRRLGANTLLSLAALIVLAWRPGDLFTAGFQLSFVTVWALLMFTAAVSRTIWPEPMVASVLPVGRSFGEVVARWTADTAAVSVVATATAMPLVAYHFQMVNPLSVVLSVLALPGLIALLGLGYLKILVGLVLPSGALVLSGPLRWVGGVLLSLVEEAATWPGSTVRLLHELPGWWVAAALAVVWLWFGGWFKEQRVAGALALGVVIGSVAWHEHPTAGRWVRDDDGGAGQPQVAAELWMLAVGDGSCFVLRVADGRGTFQTLMFDCGSQAYPLIGRRSVVPTLRQAGIERVDVLVISHADLDHYNGTLDVLDALEVGQVWVSPDVPDEARQHPQGATAYLWNELHRHGFTPRTVTRGDQQHLGKAQLDVLWPPASGWEKARGNDRSVVMSIAVAGRRVLLSGDIQQAATTALMEMEGDGNGKSRLAADVADLPHHGSFVDASETWLDAVNPQVVLQSSGPARLRRDRWAELIQARDLPRLITDRHGMVRLTIDADGMIAWKTFLDVNEVVERE